MREETIEIAERFCGPPQSGNGGYVAGRLAAFVEAPAVTVRLRASPPLAKPLVVQVSSDSVRLLDGANSVAEARATEFELGVADPPSFEEAVVASKGFRGFDEHVFPGCFVCGPERVAGDGLRIFPGPAGVADLFASPWIPDRSLTQDGRIATEGEAIPDEFVWAALDCPGAFSFPQPKGKVILLGEMSARMSGSVRVGERCVLASWKVETEGRKHFTASAIYGDDGECRGRALGLWFEVDPESVPGPSA